MKSYQLKHFSFILLSVFTLSSVPAFATSALTPAAGNTTVQISASAETTNEHVAKKKSEKRGFSAKVKNFGKKTTMFLKGLASGDHNVAIAILLTFFLGLTGIHRVYLGGRPVLILFYLITFGGIFGLLPIIDFIRLLIGQMDHYVDNDKFLAAFETSK